MTAQASHVCSACEGSFATGPATQCRFCATPEHDHATRDAEEHPLYRLAMMAIALAALIALGLFGESVEEHNLHVLREYVNAR